MDPAAIDQLLEPFLESPLTKNQLELISIYIDMLLHWNAKFNLTAIRTPEEIVTRHFGESFFLARHVFPLTTDHRPLTTVVDIGPGAGFPALPLKIWTPDISLTLIESNHKKAAFLREVIRKLTLTNINVITRRAETVTTRAEVVTLRAVERFDSILATALSLVAPHGRLALLIGQSQLPSLNPLPMKWHTPLPIPSSQARVLTIGVRP